MQELVAGGEKLRFDVEADAEQQGGAEPLPFLGLDSVQCPFQPISGEKTVVCKHWLRGLCKKGDECNFLHEYNVTKMPKCYFYSRFGECNNKGCPFLHIDATISTVGCPWYDRGFCRHGPLCKYKHTRRVMCANYLAGFCPEGPTCKFTHLKASLMTSSPDPSKGLAQLDLAASTERCKDVPPTKPPPFSYGHCPARESTAMGHPSCPSSLLEQSTCFRCGQKGRCARKCEKTLLEILLGK